jgi:hypothetical protein
MDSNGIGIRFPGFTNPLPRDHLPSRNDPNLPAKYPAKILAPAAAPLIIDSVQNQPTCTPKKRPNAVRTYK